MKNFIFKSTDADLQKMFQLLETIRANGLYATHRIDWLIKEFNGFIVDKDLEKQAHKYFDRDDDETSHQTELDEQ